MTEPIELTPIGWVESPLSDPAAAPRQGDEGAPDAWLVFEPAVVAGLEGVRAGDEVILLTWLDRARRSVLRVHPRGDASRPQQGVFSTRSPHRPNPIGLHRVEVLSVDGARVRVRDQEETERARRAGRAHVAGRGAVGPADAHRQRGGLARRPWRVPASWV
ncbi:MAG: hypothetical protein QOE65_405 [Solirubrobacteraceae bacterium]|nr:hypothetical protein [Solirubrobacteraceae bacterium]